MMLESELGKLTEAIGEIKNDLTAIALRDLFALGCILHLKGETRAGKKACDAALMAIGFKARFPEEAAAILENLEQNETALIRFIRAHMEINALIR